MVWCKAEEVVVDVALDCDGCSGVFGEYFVYCCLEIVGEVWVPVGAAVDVDEGVDGIGLL